MTNDTGAGPYQQAASLYRAAGWEGVLPLPPGLKHPPPLGWTGWGGPMPSYPDVQAWLDGPEAAGNIALRPPRGVLGIDADTYKPAGAATMRELEARLGPLPATWISSARTDGSGIRWYRVPADVPGWHSKAGEGVELVHFGHRYAVVWPSTNPDANGAPYSWTDDAGVRMRELVPVATDFPNLPDAWVEALRGPAPGAKAHLADGEALRWLEAVRDGEACPPVAGVLERARAAFASHASRYDTMRDSMRALTGFGAEGHAGTVPALVALRDAYLAATEGERRDTVGEWARALEGAIALEADRRPNGPESLCACAGTPGTLSLDFLLAPPPEEPAASAERGFDLEAETAKVVDAGPDEMMDRAFALARMLAERPIEEQAQVWAEFKRIGLPLSPLKEAFREARDARRARERESVAAEAAAARRSAAAQLAEEGNLLPSPADPMAVARDLVSGLPHRDGMPIVARWRGDFYIWTGTHWDAAPEEEIRDGVYMRTEHARFEGEKDIEPWRPTPAKVNGVFDAMSTLLRRAGALDDDRVIATTNGVLDLTTGRLGPHTPHRFNLTSLPYAYDPAAGCPQWLAFLESSLPGDAQAHAFLQEWAGYLVSGDRSQQKIACLVGKKRAGKGTIARVLTALLGQENVTGATLSSIIGNFGLEPMIGKTLAILPDVSWKPRFAAEGAEMLKMISGEDAPPVARKNRGNYDGSLGVRFTIMTNDTPSFEDASGALAGRLIIVNFKRSFFGVEDIGLTERLLGELPGILNWALAGLVRLRERGRFIEPSSSAQTREEMQRKSGKLYGFLEDDVERAEDAVPVELDDLYEAYLAWCEDERRDYVVQRSNFTAELRDEGVETERAKKRRAVPVAGRPTKPTWVFGLKPRDGAWRVPKAKWLVSGNVGRPGNFPA